MHGESNVIGTPLHSPPDVLVNNVGTLYTFCPLICGLRNGSTSMSKTTLNGSGTHLSSNIVMRGDWLRG